MGRATEDQLAKLHNKVAETMIAALDQADRAAHLLIKYTVDSEVELPSDIRGFLEDTQEINPSLLTSATKFLKDNNISCDPAEDEQLSDLEKRLKKKKTKGNVTEIAFDE